MSTVIEEKILHNHRSNFGRYVADCPACTAKYPDGPPPKQPRQRKVKEVAAIAASAGMTEEQLMRIMVEANRALGAELRKPDPEVEAEKQAQKIRNQIAKENERTVVMEAEAKTRALQASCARMGHKQNGGLSQNSAISGQVCTGDRKFHWICVSCQMTGTRELTPDEMSMGVA